MSLVPFNRQDMLAYRPFRDLFEGFFGDSARFFDSHRELPFKMDVREELLHYTVEAEMPGVKKEDVQVEFLDGQLTVTVNHEEISDEEKKKYIRKERVSTSETRSVYLEGVKSTGITAALTDGLLRITVPKKEEKIQHTNIEIH